MDREELSSTLRSTRRLTVTRRSSLTVPVSSSDTDVLLHPRHRTEKFILVRLDSTIDKLDVHSRNLLMQLNGLVNTCKMFTDVNECVQFLTQVVNEKILFIVSGFTGEYMMRLVHDMTQVDSIYVLCGNVRRHEPWAKKWSKIKGVFAEMNSICEILRQILLSQRNFTPIRPIPMSDAHYPALGFLAHDDDVQKKNLDELDPSFMFTKVLKEILLELEYDNESMSELVKFCRGLFQENDQELVIIDDFEKNYSSEMAIWWYTRESFLYKMLNPALRTLDANTIIKMGFFLRDLHMQITRLHREQNTNDKHSKSFTVYRGQALTSRDFDQLKKANGGLMSFNNFLSTSLNHKIALEFAQGANSKIDHVGILFVMQIDSSNSSTPFARVTDVAYYTAEEETLFSMHSIFRINSIEKKSIDGKDLWQVNLILTDDDDQELQNLTERLREETQGSSGWDRMGKLLIKLGMFVSAEDTYNVLLKQTVTNIEKAHIYHQLGYIKEDLGQFNDALEFYEKSLDLKKKDPPSDNSHFAIYYNNIGSVYDKKGDYSIAVSFFKKAIEIFQKILHPNHPRLATCYNNIGSANHNMCAYSTALFYYEKAIEIDEQCLPLNDPSLGIDYNNKGLVYYDMKEYDQALSCFQQTLDIYKKSLQPDHTYFSNIYSNFGTLYNSMENYSEALLYYQKALEIDQKALPGNHPSLGISYNNIGSVYKNMAEYSQALSMFECAFDIENSAQSPNPSHLQSYINNIEFVKEKLQEMHS